MKTLLARICPFIPEQFRLLWILLLLLCLLSSGCVTAPDGSRRLDPLAVNSIAALAVDLAANRLGISPESARAIRTGSADLFGIAAQAQANLGQKPATARIAQGAALPEIGQAVQAQLPNAPITQATADALFEAAAQAKQINTAP